MGETALFQILVEIILLPYTCGDIVSGYKITCALFSGRPTDRIFKGDFTLTSRHRDCL